VSVKESACVCELVHELCVSVSVCLGEREEGGKLWDFQTFITF
jgi:hypothetical protein